MHIMLRSSDSEISWIKMYATWQSIIKTFRINTTFFIVGQWESKQWCAIIYKLLKKMIKEEMLMKVSLSVMSTVSDYFKKY